MRLVHCSAIGATFWLVAGFFMPAVAADCPGPITVQEAVPTIPWQSAGDYIGRDVFAVGKIVRTGKSRTGHAFLNFDRDRGKLTVFIRGDRYAKFPEPPEKAYRDKMVKVRGFISEFKGAPEIAAAGPEAITILPDDAPLPAAPKPPASQPAVGDTITLGSYNVLNLFDACDDPYTNDEGTEPKPRAQLEALAKTIHTLNADVLALIEVENRGYLQEFVNVFLPDMGYEVVEYEGNDMRGIDVALLSRLPVGPVTSYRHLRFPDSSGKPTHFQRDLLRVRLEPPGGVAFDVFVVHYKSKDGVETGGLEIRLGETRETRQILDGILKTDPSAAFVICGDFNDTIDSAPLKALLGSGPAALVSFIGDLPAGENVTYNQPPHLSMIDFILASPEMAKHYVPKSYHILTGGSPDTSGSDHNPVVARFKLK